MNIRIPPIVFLCIIILAYQVHAQTTFKNPIITGMNPDPSICRAGEDYYLVTSTFEYFPGLPVYQSKDLVHWKLIGYALARASSNPLMGCDSSFGGQYAATIRYNNGTFYVSGTNYGGQGTQGMFYVTATNPAGPWSDPVWVGEWNVDPSIYFEGGTMYFLSPNNQNSFLLGTMNPANGQFITYLQWIADGLGGSSPEGPHLYKRNNYYYLLSAEGGTGYEHREVVQRSTSIWGPYAASPVNPVATHMNDPGNPFHAIGHADFIETPDGWWAVCLGIRPVGGNYHHLGRETFLSPVTWNADGWPKMGTNGIIEEEYPVPNLPQYTWGEDPVRDDFNSTTLNLWWNFVRNPHTADWSLTANPSFLRLNGSNINFTQKDSPAFVCRRQTAFNIVASTKINFIPNATNEEAGLVIRGNDTNHYDFLITRNGGTRAIMLRKYLKGNVAGVNYRSIPDGDIILRISATELEYQFWIQQEGSAAEVIGSALTRDLSTEVITGFTGVFIGMYASGNGSNNANPAYFDWFDYEVDPTLPYPWATGSTSPYLGTPAQIPGKIEAENYDIGGNGLSYYDTDTANNGGQYRTDAVDIETCTDEAGGYDVGWTGNGEWLTYTVDVTQQISRIDLRIASTSSGGQIKIIFDGNEIGIVSIPNTGDWQQWQTVSLSNILIHPVSEKILRLEFINGGFNLNWISFITSSTPEPEKGDVNDDGIIDIVDALLVARYYVGLSSDINTDAADTNCDGIIDIVDALLIAQYYVGLITGFC